MPPAPLPPPGTTETADGWVKSIDPRTDRAFYANRITKKTQWEPPPGWEQGTSATAATTNANRSTTTEASSNISQINSNVGGSSSASDLPGGWEEMTDPSSGKTFYVDHANKITTWKRPVAAAVTTSKSTTGSTSNHIPNVRATPNATTSSDRSSVRESNASSSAYYGDQQQQAAYSNEDAGYQFDSLIAAEESYTPNFVVRKIGDKERLECPQCSAPFTIKKRRCVSLF